MSYCVLCGNTGIDINNRVCVCRANVKSFFDEVTCLDIPEQYRGIRFNKSLLPDSMGSSYGQKMQSVYNKILEGSWSGHNLLIASPVSTGKTILAYSCLEILFRKGVQTFPVFDLLEIKRMLLDMDFGRKSVYDVDAPENLFKVPMLFTRIPRLITQEVFNTMAVLLDRRVRRGNSTIFLYSGSWKFLLSSDKTGTLESLVGDGTYGTFELMSYYKDGSYDEERSIDLPENLG